MDLAINALLADAAGDELGVLRPEVEDEDQIARLGHGGGEYHWRPAAPIG